MLKYYGFIRQNVLDTLGKQLLEHGYVDPDQLERCTGHVRVVLSGRQEHLVVYPAIFVKIYCALDLLKARFKNQAELPQTVVVGDDVFNDSHWVVWVNIQVVLVDVDDR